MTKTWHSKYRMSVKDQQ